MMAFPPRSAACSINNSSASSRVFSHMSVKSVIFPPTIVCSDAPIFPKMLRERTMIPRTSPSVRTTRYPGSSNAVVTMPISTLPFTFSSPLRIIADTKRNPRQIPALLIHHGHFHAGGILPRTVNPLRGFDVIARRRLKNIRHEFLRVAIDNREPRALHLPHDAMPLQEAMIVRVQVNRVWRHLVRHDCFRFLEAI